MRHNFGSLIIRIVAFIVVVAFVSYGCSASRVVRKEIVRGKLEKTGVEKKYVNEQICLQELSPLQIKAMKISETKEIRKKYYRKKNIVETMRLQDLHPGRTTAEGTFVILASAFMIVITFGLALLVLAPAYKRDWKKAEEHEKENLNRCQYDGQVINGWRCTKDILEEEIAGDNAYETVQEEIVVDKKESPASNINVLVTVNETFRTRITSDSKGITSLKLYEFPELATSGQSARIEYRAGDALLTTQLPRDEVEKVFASLTPPHLRIKTKILLEDGLSTGILQADDSGSMVVEILNDGKGLAFGVKLHVSGSHPGLNFNNTHEIGEMKPGETRSVRIPVTAALDVRDGKIDFAFQAKEQMGRDSLPLKLQPSIIIKELDKPHLVLTSFSWTDSGGYASGNGNNIPENNETVELNVKVQNNGKGLAKGVSLRIKDLPGVKPVVSEAGLGNIPPGGIKEGRLAVHFPKLYKPNEKDIPLNVTVSDSRPIGVSASKGFRLPYQYNEPGLKLARVEIFDGDPNTNSKGNMNHLIDQDEEIEMHLYLENAGTLQAEGVNISLTTNKQNVRITPSIVDMGTLPAGEKKRFASFAVEVPASVSPGPITFNIDVKQKDYPPVIAKLDRTVMEASAVGIAIVKGGGTLMKGGVMVAVPENIDEVPYLADHRNKNAYAVVIGIGNYKKKEVSALAFAKSDAESISNYLENIGGFAKENVQTLTETGATLTEMRRYIKDWLLPRVDRTSLVVVYFSGHGVPEPDKKAPYLLPYDGDPNMPRSTAYALSELKADINALPTKNVVIALDACYSGQGRSASPTGGKGVHWVEDDKTPTEAVMISASKWDQTAWDYPEKSHGLFTYFLLKGMRGKEVDANGDGYVDTDELFGYLTESCII